MKIMPISINFRGNNTTANNYDSAYLYTPEEVKKKNYLPQYSLITGIVALTAVLITLFNIGSRR